MTKSNFLSREPARTSAEFVGRAAALTWAASQLGRETPQNCNIVGEPRIGKSSLLHAIYRDQVGLPPGRKGVYVWARLVEWANRAPGFFWTQLLLRMHEAAGDAGLHPPKVVAKSGETAWQAYHAIEILLEHVQRVDKEARVVVLIDDFELLVPELAEQGLDWLRALATRFASQFAFVIASTDPLEKVCAPVANQVSPLHNTFVTYHLGLLAEAEAERLIEAALATAGEQALATEYAQFLRNEAGRHPDLLKAACVYLLQARADEGEELSREEMEAALCSDIRYDASVRWLCGRLFARRSKEERALLLGVAANAAGGDPILFRQMERKLGLVELREGEPAVFADCWRYWLEREAGAPGRVLEASVPAAPARQAPPEFDYEPDLREVRLGERVRQLTPVEDRLLRHLMTKPNKVCTAQELLDEVWGGGRTESVVEKTVNRLREKVEEDSSRPRSIVSLRGEGYMLRMDKPG